jgi:hypothetical protein
MKQDALKTFKLAAFDWIFKGLLAIVCFLVKDMRDDVKQLMQVVPGVVAKVDMLNDQRLIDKFKVIQAMPAKSEDDITYDSLKHK